jgi:hypothetical protein
MPTAELLDAVRRWRRDPAHFARSVLGIETLWARQVEILEALRDHRRVAVPSCHESGKTMAASVAAVHHLLAYQPSKVVTTAPTTRQVKDLLWAEIRARHGDMIRTLGGDPGLGAPTQTGWEIESDWFATGFATSPDKAQENATRFQGYHSPHLLVVLDEAGGVPREVWTAVEGLLTSSNARVLAIGQPQAGSEFERVCRSPDWRVIRISAFDCPNVQPGATAQSWGVTREWVEQMGRRFGTGSVVYLTKVLGLFPDVADDTLLSLLDVEKAMSRTPPMELADRVALGVDVARFGSDETVIYVVRGPAVVAVESFAGQDTMRTAGATLRLAREYGLNPDEARRIAIDDGGLGGGVVDRLGEQGWSVRAVNFGAAATGRGDVKFANARTAIWWGLREWVRDDATLGELPDETKDVLRADLCAPKYVQKSDGRIALEPKADIKARVGRSPDHGDALALAVLAQSGRSWSYGTSFGSSRDERTKYDERDEFDEALARGEAWAIEKRARGACGIDEDAGEMFKRW